MKNSFFQELNEKLSGYSPEESITIILKLLFIRFIFNEYDYTLKRIKDENPNNWKEIASKKNLFSSKYGCYIVLPNKISWETFSKLTNNYDENLGKEVDNFLSKLLDKNPDLENHINFEKNEFNDIDQTILNNLFKIITEKINFKYEENRKKIVSAARDFFRYFYEKTVKDGERFHTPSWLIKLLVQVNETTEGAIYDPYCLVGEIFVEVKRYLKKTKRQPKDLIVFGQEKEKRILEWAELNLIINGFNYKDVSLVQEEKLAITIDKYPEKVFDFIISDLPFNKKNWWTEELTKEARYCQLKGTLDKKNDDFAWIKHILYKLKEGGRASILLSNSSLKKSRRKNAYLTLNNIIENNWLDGIIQLPTNIFYEGNIRSSIWIFNKKKNGDGVFLVYAENMGQETQQFFYSDDGKKRTKKRRELQDSEIEKIVKMFKIHREGSQKLNDNISKTVFKKDLLEQQYSFNLLPSAHLNTTASKNSKSEEKLKTIYFQIEKEFKNLSVLFDKMSVAIKKKLVKNQS